MNTNTEGVATLTPRPVYVAKAPHDNQRYAPGSAGIHAAADNHRCIVRVFRFAGDNQSELGIRITGYGELCARLTASELREVAQCCIDMAHDIEANLNG